MESKSLEKGKYIVHLKGNQVDEAEAIPNPSKNLSTHSNLEASSTRDNSPDCCSKSFCNMTNIASAVVYLNQELQNLGLRCKLIEANGTKLNLVSLVNSCWDIIQMYHAAVRDGNSLHDHRQRDVADLNYLQGSVKSLKTEVETKDRLILEAQEKERQMNSMNKALASKLKAEKEEIRRMNGILQQREAQHQHIVRKKEAEVIKLQERLHRLVSGDRGTDGRMSSLSMTSSLNRSDKARGRWKTDNSSIRHEEELYRKVLSQYETWVGQLTDEGDQLKECLASVASKISKTANKCLSLKKNLISEADLLNGSVSWPICANNDGDGEEPIFSLDFRSVRKQIQERLDSNLQLIDLSLENKEPDKPIRNFVHGSESSTNKEILDKEEKFIETCFNDSLLEHMERLTDSQLVEEEAELKEEMRAVREEKRKLQKERETFAIAAVRLNREKADFEAEKVALLRYQFLEDLPNSLRSCTKEPFTPNTSFEIPVKESLSDLFGDSPKTLMSMPCLTSPKGNIFQTSQPLTIGTPRISHHREGSRAKHARTQIFHGSASGKSAPATRNSSINRREDHSCSDFLKVRTLERMSKTTCLSTLSLNAGKKAPSVRSTSLSSTTATCFDERSQTQPQSPTESIHSTRHQSVDSLRDKRRMSKRFSVEELSNSDYCYGMNPKQNSKTWASQQHRMGSPLGGEASGEDYLTSVDSGFYYEDSEPSTTGTINPRDTQTNLRLDALETSLVILLDQIKARSLSDQDTPDTNFQHDSSVFSSLHAKEAFSGEDDVPRKGTFSLTTDFNPPSTSTSGNPFEAPCKDRKQPTGSDRRLSRLVSAPGSLASSRKSSQDRRPGEDYLKKLQNSFSKWYFKSS